MGQIGYRSVNFACQIVQRKNEGLQLAATEALLRLAVRFELPRFGDPQPPTVSS